MNEEQDNPEEIKVPWWLIAAVCLVVIFAVFGAMWYYSRPQPASTPAFNLESCSEGCRNAQDAMVGKQDGPTNLFITCFNTCLERYCQDHVTEPTCQVPR